VSPKPRGLSLITTRHAAIAHDQVGADADDMHRKLARQVGEKIGEIVFVAA